MNPGSPGQITQEAATLVYVNANTFAGEDQFNVTLVDNLGASTVVTVSVQLSSDLRLRIAPALSGNVRISWPATATSQGFRLLSGNSVDAIGTAVTTGITTEGLESAIQVPSTGVAAFFRLVYP